MMSEFVIRVTLPNGNLTTVTIRAVSPGIAIEQARMYGQWPAVLESRYV